MHAAILRYFVAVARTGSIRKASEELHVASSALSRQIAKLEDELGMALFDRLPNGLQLTKAGEVTLRHARATLDDFEVLKGELGELAGNMTGLVRIASLDSLLVHFLPEQIHAFREKHSKVDFRIQSGQHHRVAQLVAGGEADFGITFNLPHPEDTRFGHDVAMPLMAMVAAEHPLAKSSSVTLTECAQYNLLLHLDNEPLTSVIDIELSVFERVGRALVTSNNLIMLRSMVLSGSGVAFYTPIGMSNEIKDGRIVAVPLRSSQLESLRVGLLMPRRRQLTRAAAALAEQMGAALSVLSSRLIVATNTSDDDASRE